MEDFMGALFMMVFSAIASVVFSVFGVASIIVLSKDGSWFSDAISTWLSVNTIVTLSAIGILWTITICLFCCCSGCIIGTDGKTSTIHIFNMVCFWIMQLAFVIWGTVQLASESTEHTGTRNMAIAVVVTQWLGFALIILAMIRGCCCGKSK